MLHELSAAPSPLKIRIVCIPEEIRQIYFSTSVFISERKKKLKEKKSVFEPHPHSPLPLCFLMVDLSKPSVAFTEGLMVSAKPANPWREWSLRANEEQLVSPCL